MEQGIIQGGLFEPYPSYYTIGESSFPIHHLLSSNPYPERSFLLELPILIFLPYQLGDFLSRWFMTVRSFEEANLNRCENGSRILTALYCGPSNWHHIFRSWPGTSVHKHFANLPANSPNWWPIRRNQPYIQHPSQRSEQ